MMVSCTKLDIMHDLRMGSVLQRHVLHTENGSYLCLEECHLLMFAQSCPARRLPIHPAPAGALPVLVTVTTS